MLGSLGRYGCAIIPDFLYCWYMVTVQGHAKFLSSTVG